MRPIALEFAGFGPYVQRQVINFDDLDNVFVVSGETGAGKTTIFDAMSYALYGLPLGGRPTDAVRSTLAGPMDATYVRFRFSCQGKTFEIFRSPWHAPRPKRGGGVIADEKVVTVADVGPDGVLTVRPNLKPRDVLELVAEAGMVGLKHEEFSTVIVLPQGKFQRFLELNSKDRAELVRSLFPVEDASTVTAMAKAAAGDRLEVVRELVIKLKHLESLFDLPRYDEDLAEGEAQVAEAAEHERRQRAGAEAAQAGLVGGRALAAAVAQHASATARLDELEALRPAIDAARWELDQAGKAARAEVALRALRELAERIRQQQGVLVQHEATLATRQAAVEAQRPAFDALPPREQALRELEGKLAEVTRQLADVDALVRARAEALSRRQARERADAEVGRRAGVAAEAEAAVAALAPLQAERDALEPVLLAAREHLARVESVSPSAKEVAEWARSGRDALAKKDAAAAVEQSLAQDALAGAEVQLAEARSALEADAVAILAQGLELGQPCPVCGSPEHPAPAPGTAATANVRGLVATAEATVQLARRAVSMADGAVAQLATERGLREARVTEASERLLAAGFTSPDQHGAALLAARSTLASTSEEADRLAKRLAARPQAEARRVAAHAATSEAQGAANLAAQAQAQAEGVAAAADERLGGVTDPEATRARLGSRRSGLTTEIETERGTIDQVRRVFSEAERLAAGARGARNAAAATLAASQQALPAAATLAEVALATEGFATAEDVARALRSAETESTLRQRIARFDTDVAGTVARLDELAITIAGRPAPDLPALEEQAATAAREHAEAWEALGRARASVASLVEKKTQHDAFTAEKLRVEREARGLLDLARSLNGENPRRISFPTFVLTAWFSRVVAYASTRLRRLSQGQYTFVLRPDTSDKRSEGGLDLAVFDAHSTVQRDVSTLSGGEKFLASLSLALGLADVIAEKSGGVQIDTLFIDEGFGSLDANTLDRALDVVGDIAATRRVGLISHVEAVKKAIPCHVEVLKSPTGSSISVPG